MLCTYHKDEAKGQCMYTVKQFLVCYAKDDSLQPSKPPYCNNGQLLAQDNSLLQCNLHDAQACCCKIKKVQPLHYWRLQIQGLLQPLPKGSVWCPRGLSRKTHVCAMAAAGHTRKDAAAWQCISKNRIGYKGCNRLQHTVPPAACSTKVCVCVGLHRLNQSV